VQLELQRQNLLNQPAAEQPAAGEALPSGGV